MDFNPSVHVVKGRVDRRRLHAHGLGAARPSLCHSGAAASGVSVRGDYGARIGLHAPHTARILRDGVARVKRPDLALGDPRKGAGPLVTRVSQASLRIAFSERNAMAAAWQ